MSRIKIVEAAAGRLRGETKGWAVALTTEHKGFARIIRHEVMYTKRDDELFWEDENGWYIAPTSEAAVACDAAVKAHTPWRVEGKGS